MLIIASVPSGPSNPCLRSGMQSKGAPGACRKSFGNATPSNGPNENMCCAHPADKGQNLFKIGSKGRSIFSPVDPTLDVFCVKSRKSLRFAADTIVNYLLGRGLENCRFPECPLEPHVTRSAMPTMVLVVPDDEQDAVKGGSQSSLGSEEV